jgi:hypothetical protein
MNIIEFFKTLIYLQTIMVKTFEDRALVCTTIKNVTDEQFSYDKFYWCFGKFSLLCMQYGDRIHV